MKRSLLFLPFYLFTLLPFLTACIDEEEYADTPNGNFEALWHIMDEHYCFFDYKKQTLGVDWDEVYQRYRKQFHSGMTESQEFEVLANMLSELRDGHVNLYSSFDVARNWSWHEDFPQNFSD
ncbi:MAG: peptidase S41, partial [Prevotella sp.]|nr:peptidase S41 [Prevotella sp.]